MMNIWIGTGRVVRAPALAKTQSGKEICNFSIAVPKNKDSADFFDVVAWGQLAVNLAPHLRKGKRVTIIGELHNRDWVDKDGHKRRNNEITAQKIDILDYDKTDEGDLPF